MALQLCSITKKSHEEICGFLPETRNNIGVALFLVNAFCVTGLTRCLLSETAAVRNRINNLSNPGAYIVCM